MHFDIKNVTLGQKMVIWQVQFWIFGLWVGFDPPARNRKKNRPLRIGLTHGNLLIGIGDDGDGVGGIIVGCPTMLLEIK